MIDAVASLPVPAAVYSMPEMDRLLDVFTKVCINGKASFKAEEVTSSNYEAMPKPLQRWFQRHDDLAVYAIRAEQPTYVIVFTPKKNRNSFKHVCAIASPALTIGYDWDKLTLGKGTAQSDAGYDAAYRTVLSRPKDGYEISFSRVGYGFTAVQVSILNDRQTEAAAKSEAEIALQMQKNPAKLEAMREKARAVQAKSAGSDQQ